MKKNRIIVSGLSLLQDVVSPNDDSACFACDFDLEWMFNHPSTLIWADAIIVSPSIINSIKKEVSPYGDSNSWGKIARIFFEVADDLGVLEIKDPGGLLTQNFFDSIEARLEKERVLLSRQFPDAARYDDNIKVPGSFSIIDQH